MKLHETYMQRCIALARLAAGNVAPNPMVGAVLVYEDRIIGEGYHQQYGQAHAEVNCINAVRAEDQHLIEKSTLYVSLEPCAHFGKTPPCADLIIAKEIPQVVIGCRDPYKEVDGKGIDKLLAAGVELVYPVMENECRELNKRFFTFHTKQRPFIVVKWAQTANGFIGQHNQRLLISNAISNRLVHKWRSEETAIMVGTNTALQDNPQLSNRLFTGHQPVRIVLDNQLRLPSNLHLLDGSSHTIVFNKIKQEEKGNILYYRLPGNESLVQEVCSALSQLNIQSVLVEGGRQLLQAFIDENIFDEARVITNTGLTISEGIPAPVLGALPLQQTLGLQSDSIQFYQNGL